jgi:2-polyprenyl-3-methyl-5-hydroxy-6-metoxy-1,4-benzoquinol methylase
MTTDDLLAEQLAYYRSRAAEYDDWWERRGRYDRGDEATARWLRERAEVFDKLDQVSLRGDILELAAGTGIWTDRLVRTARTVTVVDASPEMIRINRPRLGGAAASVSYTIADLFEWTPSRRYDAVVFCFWMSHVPESRLEAFFRMVNDGLRPAGRLFFVDGKREPTSTAVDHELPRNREEEVMVRRLNDGTEFRIVKIFRKPSDIERRARTQGLAVSVGETDTFFQYGVGTKQ